CPEGHEFEHFYRKISDAAAELPCPACGKPAERRLSGGAGLVFKGSGFYLTDYGKNAHRKSGGDGGDKSGSKSTDGSSSDGKSSDSKSESKSEKSETKSSDSSSKSESKPTESKPSSSS